MIIGRRNEIKELRSMLASDTSKMGAVYGRRRVGKTFLVEEAFERTFAFHHAGVSPDYKLTPKERDHIQKRAFLASLKEQGAFVPDQVPESWFDVFILLEDFLQERPMTRKVVFLDELAWMDVVGFDFYAAFERFWNTWCDNRTDIVLVVAASATAWMMRNIVHSTKGFHNRISVSIDLQPFKLKECKEYLESIGNGMSKDDILRAYMVFGGVPYYWSLFPKGMSLAQIIDHLCFAKNALLKNELQYLYKSLYRGSDNYEGVVKFLSGKTYGVTMDDIANSKVASRGGRLSERLEDLESCGFVCSYPRFGNKKNKRVYQLMDPFMIFHYTFMSKNHGDPQYWSHHQNDPKAIVWQGLSFEKVCLWHIDEIKASLGIAGVATETCSYRIVTDEERGILGHQIDLLIHRADNVINLCEMKYSNREYVITKNEEADFRTRVMDFVEVTKTRCSVQFTMITNLGLKENMHSGIIASSVCAEDFF